MGKYRIPPKETRYKGEVFRSRTEARWAIFFDLMGILWDYEPGCYDSGSYLYKPDFWLDTLQCFAEVKPDLKHFTKDNLEQCTLLSKSTQKAVLVLDGLPDKKGYNVITPNGVYHQRYAVITLKRMEGSMDHCLKQLAKDPKYCRAVDSARGHVFV